MKGSNVNNFTDEQSNIQQRVETTTADQPSGIIPGNLEPEAQVHPRPEVHVNATLQVLSQKSNRPVLFEPGSPKNLENNMKSLCFPMQFVELDLESTLK